MSYTPGDVFQAALQYGANWNVQKNQAGGLGPTTNNSNLTKNVNYGKGTNTVGNADTVVCATVSIAATATGNYFLSSGTPSFTDLLGQAGVIFARIKSLTIQLLSPSDDPITPGTLASSITIGAGTHPFVGNLAGTAPTITLNNGDVHSWATGNAAGYVVTNGSNDQLNVVNNDAGLAAKVRFIIVGSSA